MTKTRCFENFFVAVIYYTEQNWASCFDAGEFFPILISLLPWRQRNCIFSPSKQHVSSFHDKFVIWYEMHQIDIYLHLLEFMLLINFYPRFKCMIDYVLYMLVVTANTFYISWGFQLHFLSSSENTLNWKIFWGIFSNVGGKRTKSYHNPGNILTGQKWFVTLKINSFIWHNLNLLFFRRIMQSVFENSIVLF